MKILKKIFFLCLVLPLATIAFQANQATATVVEDYSAQLTTDSHYDRNPSAFKANDGNYWLFFVRSVDGDPNYGSGCLGKGCDESGCNCDAASYEIYYMISADKGVNWSAPIILPNSISQDHRGMAAFQDDTGKIRVFISAPSGDGKIHYYTYDGASWSGPVLVIKPVEYPAGLNGSHIDAFQTVMGTFFLFYENNGVKTIYSTDYGVSWSSVNTVDGTSGMGIPKAMQDASGKLHCVYANWVGGKYYYSTSLNGINWTPQPSPVDIPGTTSCDPVIYQNANGEYGFFYAPWDSGTNSQWLEHITSSDGITWSSPTKITNGGDNTATYWWDMWPEVLEDSGDIYLFYTSEENNNARGDGNIFVYQDRAPTISNLTVVPTSTLAGENITITADVADDFNEVAAVSADFSFDLGFTDRPSPTSVAMANIGDDQYQVVYKIPKKWEGRLVYVKIAARDTLNNYGRSDDYETVVTHPYAWYVDDNSIECPFAEFSSIQAAVSSPDVWAGDTIMVCPGFYHENVTVDKSLKIKSSEDSSSTILDGTGITGDGFLIQANKVTISGFTIQSFNTTSNGIYLDNVEKICLERNEIKKNINGIRMTDSNDIKIKRNDIHDNSGSGIYVYETSFGITTDDIEISRNEIYNHSTTVSSRGISASTAGNWKNNDWNIKRNELTNNNRGIRLVNTEQIQITRNEIGQSAAYGIYLRSKDGAQVNQIKIEKNTISNSLTSGIRIIAGVDSSLENIEIAKNKIHNNQDGIQFEADSTNSQIKDNELNRNKIYDNSGLGMFFLGNGVSSNQILRNEIKNNASIGMSFKNGCHQNLIEKNKIHQNGSTGLKLFNGINDNFIFNNRMEENGGSGIYINGSNNNLVKKNRSYSNGFNGIALVNSSNNNIIQRNRTKDNKKFDLNYDGFGNGNSNKNNRFKTSSPDDWWEE